MALQRGPAMCVWSWTRRSAWTWIAAESCCKTGRRFALTWHPSESDLCRPSSTSRISHGCSASNRWPRFAAGLWTQFTAFSQTVPSLIRCVIAVIGAGAAGVEVTLCLEAGFSTGRIADWLGDARRETPPADVTATFLLIDGGGKCFARIF